MDNVSAMTVTRPKFINVPLAMGLVGPDGTELPTRLEGESAGRAGTPTF